MITAYDATLAWSLVLLGGYVYLVYLLDCWLEEHGVQWHEGESSYDPIVPSPKKAEENERIKKTGGTEGEK